MQKAHSLKKLIIFWTGAVLFNALLCFWFGLMISHHLMSIIGMLAGIICFVAFYTFIDYKLLIHEKFLWHRALRQSSLIKGYFQLSILLHFSVEFFCGYLALGLLETLFGRNLPLFLHSFLATLITGLFLSIILIVFCLICFIPLKIHSQPNE